MVKFLAEGTKKPAPCWWQGRAYGAKGRSEEGGQATAVIRSKLRFRLSASVFAKAVLWISLKTLPQSCSAARRARALLAPGSTLARRAAGRHFFISRHISRALHRASDAASCDVSGRRT